MSIEEIIDEYKKRISYLDHLITKCNDVIRENQRKNGVMFWAHCQDVEIKIKLYNREKKTLLIVTKDLKKYLIKNK